MRAGAEQRWRRGTTVGALFALLAAASPSAIADSGLRLSGFGTFGYALDQRSDITAARDISQKPAHGHGTGATARIDSRLGVQFEYGLRPGVDLVAQIVWRDQFRADANSSIELAYVALAPKPELDIRLGRINYDAFLMSDHRNVGYAYTPVRPPAEFYGWIPIFSVDGIDAAYNVLVDDVRWRFKAQAGASRVTLPIQSGYTFKTNNLLGASVSRQSGSWRLKAAYSQFTVGSEVPDLVALHQGLDQLAAAGIPQVSSEAADLRANLTFANARVNYTTLGAAYDDGVWLGQAELGYTTASAAMIPHGRMGYVNVGRRLGDWTPYVQLGFSQPGNGLRNAAGNWGAFNATLRDPALFTLNATRIEQSTMAIGTRWDFHPLAALKLQWERTLVKSSGYGLWWRDIAINGQSTRVNLISASVDFSF